MAVLDSGVEPGADPAPVAFYDFTQGGRRSTPYDDYGHGTHVSGLIAGSGRLSQLSSGADPSSRVRAFQGIAPAAR